MKVKISGMFLKLGGRLLRKTEARIAGADVPANPLDAAYPKIF